MTRFLPVAAFCAFLFAGIATAEEKAAENFQRFSAVPVLGYSEETGLKYGAMLLLFSKPDAPGMDASSLDFAAMGTTKGQVEIDFSPDLYLLEGQIHSDISFVYWNWRAKYYGVGNDPDRDSYARYDMDLFSIDVPVDIGVLPPPLSRYFRLGPYYSFETNSTSFSKGTVPSPELSGGNRSGLGYQALLDFRDNVNWPVRGVYARIRQVFYAEAFGSDFDYFSQTIDLRSYAYLFWGTSVAVGAYYDLYKGDVPFDRLATLDGYKRFRGVERGMFLDNQSFSAQAELRKTLVWRLAGTLFFEAGKVGPYFSELTRNDWHYAPGFGGRLLLNKAEKTYARCDFSWVDGKYFGLTIYLREAF